MSFSFNGGRVMFMSISLRFGSSRTLGRSNSSIIHLRQPSFAANPIEPVLDDTNDGSLAIRPIHSTKKIVFVAGESQLLSGDVLPVAQILPLACRRGQHAG